MAHFFNKIEELAKKKDSVLCVGLDPRVNTKDPVEAAKQIIEQNRRIIDQTADHTICYKPNVAFYEQFGIEGIKAFEDLLSYIPNEIPILADTKRNDIGATAEAYAQALFGYYDNIQATTLSPYMGRDSIDPFLKYEDKGLFLLCRTSNPSAKEIQDLSVEEGTPLYIKMAETMTSWSDRIGLVVGGNDIEALTRVREVAENAWFLAPGIGAQGGTMEEAIAAGSRSDGYGVLPNVSRAVAGADSPKEAAKKYNEDFRKARDKVFSSKSSSKPVNRLKNDILKGLITTECFRVGEFTLKSGKKSPFYIDLRRVQSDPVLLKKAAKAYASLITKKYDRVAGIPVAGLPLATALSLETGIPLIFPRMTAKAHGTGNKVEGDWKKGERVLLLDDLITTGKSKIEAIDILREAGLIVEDLVVLLERGAQGAKDMKAANINLLSYAHVSELLEPCHELKLIDDSQLKEMTAYAEAE